MKQHERIVLDASSLREAKRFCYIPCASPALALDLVRTNTTTNPEREVASERGSVRNHDDGHQQSQKMDIGKHAEDASKNDRDKNPDAIHTGEDATEESQQAQRKHELLSKSKASSANTSIVSISKLSYLFAADSPTSKKPAAGNGNKVREEMRATGKDKTNEKPPSRKEKAESSLKNGRTDKQKEDYRAKERDRVKARKPANKREEDLEDDNVEKQREQRTKKRKTEKSSGDNEGKVSNNDKEHRTSKRKDHRYLSAKAMEPCINSRDIVQNHLRAYHLPHHEDGRDKSPERREVADFKTMTLEYPGTDASEEYALVIPWKEGEHNPIQDIYFTTQFIVKHCVPPNKQEAFGDEKQGIMRRVMKACHRRDIDGLLEAVNDFNTEIKSLKSEGIFDMSEIEGAPAGYKLTIHILEQAYARTVAPDADLLRDYKSFSNNVYGEVKHKLVREFIKVCNIQPHHVFLDMGSGIGNVVLQIAAQVLCESHGIEIMDKPAQLAAKQCDEFVSRMRYYGKPCGKIKLRHADFLEDTETHEVLKRADIIFVNNYAFDADLNHKILNLFLDLRDGTKVISLKSFVSSDRKINHRNANSLESIFRVTEHFYGVDCVSWMSDGGKYYVHTVDRSWLANQLQSIGLRESRSRSARNGSFW